MARLMISAAPPWNGALMAARSAPARRCASRAAMSCIQSLRPKGVRTKPWVRASSFTPSM
jgi:hypothetical protein